MQKFKDLIARRLVESSWELSQEWLARLSNLLPVEDNEVLPSETLLDHIPLLFDEIATSLTSPDGNGILVSSVVTQKAQELGRLHYDQSASIHQIVREFDILASILEEFVIEAAAGRSGEFAIADCVETVALLSQAVRTLMQTTIDTFVAEYADAIEVQRQRLVDFNRKLSHELRGPMNTLRIVATLMETSEQSSFDGRRKLAGLVQSGVDRLHAILNDLESLSGMGTAADQTPASQEIDLAGVVRDVTIQLEELTKARGVEIRVQENMPRLVVDVGKLELTLVNLVANAIKYSDVAKAERFVEIRASVDPASVTIKVADNGLGIPGESQGKIFDRFFRAHAQIDAELGVEGSGLGLAIVQDCVERMNGAIRFESVPGEGTTFWVSLPGASEEK